MANMQAFEFLCRICASDTKGKSSVAECVYVLKTADLKQKIKKYLDLMVSEDDALPKVICKSCYRSVEGIVSLSKIAVHTQMVLSNFLKPRIALIEPDSEFTTIVSPVKDYERALGGETQSNAAAKPANNNAPPVTTQISNEKTKRTEDVVVNVSVSDPLTRETQQKILGASRQRQTLLDSRFIPKSIAHRHVSFSTSTPKDSVPEPMNLNLAKKNTTTPPSAAGGGNADGGGSGGVISFINSQKPQQQVTFTSGGYVIGQMNPHESTMSNTSSSTVSLKAAPPTPENEQRNKALKMSVKNGPRGVNSGQVSLLKVSHKPSSLIVNPSLSSNSLSDVSISGQQSQTPQQQQQQESYIKPRALSPPPRKARRPQRRPTIAEIPAAVEVLPREIIIAGVKKPKHRHTPAPPPATPLTALTPTSTLITSNQKTPSPPAPQAVQTPPQPAAQTKSGEPSRRSSEVASFPQQQHHQQQPVIPKSLFPDDIPLGRVIRDFDLLKLIMKALKWPVIKENMEAQLERLRNSKFTTIMSDPNLLQDTDLTQLLGPYLAPVMFAAQKLQQQQNAAAAMISPAKPAAPLPKSASPAEMPTDLSAAATANLASAIPYRLPPETSVQLVPASPEEQPDKLVSQHKSRKSIPSKRSRRSGGDSPRIREVSIIISDGEDDNNEPSNHSQTSNTNEKRCNEKSDKSKAASKKQEPYDALQQLAERSRAALNRVTSGPRPPVPSVCYPSFVDDIVLIEPEPVRKARKPPKPQESLPSVISMSSPDHLFQARALPPITRPIIKRRKTVIQSSTANNKSAQAAKTNDVTNESKQASALAVKQDTTASAAVQVPSTVANDVKQGTLGTEAVATTANASAGPDINKISVATSMSFFSGVTTHITNTTVGTVTSMAAANVAAAPQEAASPTVSPKETKEAAKKPISTKAALAEQLLEAVGLKKANGAAIDKTPSRESVQQIRSALKRSLKQAVEQNLRKNEELPVKQLADSTTKSMLKNVKLLEPVDVEDEIEKVTLQKTDRQISLLRLKSQESIKLRGVNRSPRKGASQDSVIKTPNETGDEQTLEKSKSAIDLTDESQSQPKKSAFSQTSPITSENDLPTEYTISGNNVSSTSEPKANNETKSAAESKAETGHATKKKNRKRKAIEETGGDGEDISEDAKKKEIITEYDAKSIAGGDGEAIKESTSTETEHKMEGANASTRPSRASKTSSKYYKGPDKQPLLTRPTRSTRNK